MAHRFKVFNGVSLRDVVVADKAYVTHEGRLSFFMQDATRSTVAGFAAGEWTHFNRIADQP